ncbi:MAG: YraN family protein [Candidatus Magasanikbacteria bacterium]
MPQTEKQKTGTWGEEYSASFLILKGYEIIGKNFSIPKIGEIDIIAYHDKPHFGKTLCFVEVKTRGEDDGSAERAVGKSKMKRFLQTAHIYCMERKIDIDRTPIQFEQISIYRVGGAISCHHYEIPVE